MRYIQHENELFLAYECAFNLKDKKDTLTYLEDYGFNSFKIYEDKNKYDIAKLRIENVLGIKNEYSYREIIYYFKRKYGAFIYHGNDYMKYDESDYYMNLDFNDKQNYKDDNYFDSENESYLYAIIDLKYNKSLREEFKSLDEVIKEYYCDDFESNKNLLASSKQRSRNIIIRFGIIDDKLNSIVSMNDMTSLLDIIYYEINYIYKSKNNKYWFPCYFCLFKF